MQWRRVLLFCSLVFTHVDTTDRPDVQAVSKNISHVWFIEETSENMENTTKMFQSEEQTSPFPIERSSVYMNIEKTTSQFETYKSKHEWIQAVDITQAVASIVGFSANCLTFVTLTRRNCGMGSAIRTLLRHQSVVDAVVCLLAAILVLAPPMWRTGNYIVDLIFCHIWHSQIVYWDVYLVSVWNLVTVAIERFVCVFKPLQHETIMNKKRIRMALILLHVISKVFVSLGTLQVKFEGTKCVSKYAFDFLAGAFYVYGFVVFLMWHFLPVILFISLYSYIIVKLKGRLQLPHLPKSAVIEKASKELTKTAIAVTIIFMLSTSFDLWYFLLGRIGAVVYIKNSPLQKAGVFLSIINCCANPFVYIMMMPIYRRNVLNLLSCTSRRRNSAKEGTIQLAAQPRSSEQGGNPQTSISHIKLEL